MKRCATLACLLALLPALAAPARAADYSAYLAAHWASSQGDYGQAAEQMMMAQAADPARPDLQSQAFILSLLAGRTDAARLASMLPNNPLAALVLADTRARAGEWQAAELGYAVLPRGGLSDLMRTPLLAWAQAAQGLTDKALATLDDGDANGPRQGRLLVQLTRALIADAAHRDGLADRCYRDLAADLRAPDVTLAGIIASWQMRAGHEADARATIDALVARNPDLGFVKPRLLDRLSVAPVPDARAGIALAYGIAAAMARGDRNAGPLDELLASMALRVNPAALQPVVLLADAASARGQTARAAELLGRVPQGEALYPALALRRASLLARSGDVATATSMLESLASTYPNQPDPLSALGDLLIEAKNYQGAVDAYNRAINRLGNVQSSDWALFYARGAAFERLRDWDHSDADMLRALQLSPDQPFALNFLGFSWADRNINLPRAREMIERALKLRPDDGAILDSRGWVRLRQGDLKGAIEDLERAAEMEPTDPTITGHLGDAYWQTGRKLEATHQWRRALVLKPDQFEQARIEARLRDTAAAMP